MTGSSQMIKIILNQPFQGSVNLTFPVPEGVDGYELRNELRELANQGKSIDIKKYLPHSGILIDLPGSSVKTVELISGIVWNIPIPTKPI